MNVVYQEAILHCKNAALYYVWAVLVADCSNYSPAGALFAKTTSLDLPYLHELGKDGDTLR